MNGSAAMEAEVAALGHLDLDGLRAFWRHRYGRPPALRSVELMQLMLAWRLQAEALGGLDAVTRRALKRQGRLQAEGRDLGVGTRFSREWQGRIVEVEVTEAGFVHAGVVHASLSAAATAIVGSRWNGPRFFGLRQVAS